MDCKIRRKGKSAGVGVPASAHGSGASAGQVFQPLVKGLLLGAGKPEGEGGEQLPGRLGHGGPRAGGIQHVGVRGRPFVGLKAVLTAGKRDLVIGSRSCMTDQWVLSHVEPDPESAIGFGAFFAVPGLNLSENSLSGEIPPDLGNLTS